MTQVGLRLRHAIGALALFVALPPTTVTRDATRAAEVSTAQVSPPSNDALPPELLKKLSVGVNLPPGGTAAVDVPLWESGSIVMARLETPAPAATTSTSAPRKRSKPLTSSEIGDLVAQQAARRKRPAIATFSLAVDGEVLPPIGTQSGARHDTFKSPNRPKPDRLLELTTGDDAGPLDEDLFDSEGNYNKHGIRVPLFKASGEDRFNLVYWLTRQ